MKIPPIVLIGAGLGVLGVVLYRASGGAAGIARSVVSESIQVGSELASEGVLSIGDAIGLPRTDPDECGRLVAARAWWEASFKCPAGTYLSALRQAAAAPGATSTSRPALNVVSDYQGNDWYTPII